MVIRWSDGSYLEDQDMWWLSGIFRDVNLVANLSTIQDVFVHAGRLYRDATVTVRTAISAPSTYKVGIQVLMAIVVTEQVITGTNSQRIDEKGGWDDVVFKRFM